MNDFEKWFEDQDFYTNMRFIHGDKLFDKDGDVYRVLLVQMVYQGWNTQRQRSKDEFVELTQEWHTKGWNARQGEIEKLENELSTTKQILGNVIDMEVAKVDNLKAQLNNMEACYIEKKKECDDAVYLKEEHRKRRCQLAKELTQKSLRLTDAEFEYKRIKELQAKDCLQIMRLTARNEKLSDELKALRGAND